MHRERAPPIFSGYRVIVMPKQSPKIRCALLTAAALWLIAGRTPVVTAANANDELLPSDPAAWINAPPLTPEMLKGKGVVLWFFEEECPKCRGKWPGMYELAKKYEAEPVIFIAVNSGNPREDVEQYARGVNLKWPVIVDSSRQMEKRWLRSEISLQNIHQVGLLLPNGKKTMGDWDDLEGSVQTALKGAAWKIDPKTVPAIFQPTWRLVELGKYAVAAPLVKKGLVTSNSEVKEAAGRIHAVIQAEIKAAAEKAAKARQAGDAWSAYKQYTALGAMFAGYDLPSDAVGASKELSTDEQVKRQLEAAKLLDSIKKTFPSARTDAARKRIVSRLEGLVKQHPQTDAAQEAQSLLNQAAGQ